VRIVSSFKLRRLAISSTERKSLSLTTLQFHHLNSEDKAFNISDAVRNAVSLDRIKEEIEKCIVLCANCHAIRHYNMRQNKRDSLGIAGELEELDILLATSPEEDAHNN
jgi:hypothetical protein